MQDVTRIGDEDPLAIVLVESIRTGNWEQLKQLLMENPTLSRVRIVTERQSHSGVRSLLHVATDWPGFIPNGHEIIKLLIETGADVNARFEGGHAETPLHWAASNNDVGALDVLLDSGADIEATGSVIDGGTALSDAVAFGQWAAAGRLVDRGAKMLLWHAAALGEMGTVKLLVEHEGQATKQEITQGLWLACHGGQREAAEYMHEHGAELDWVGYDGLTPLDAAKRSGADKLADWLIAKGAKTSIQLKIEQQER
ncbi:ankyrin repeat domain-containing protein [Paenibacillus sp. strain BS8-2]